MSPEGGGGEIEIFLKSNEAGFSNGGFSTYIRIYLSRFVEAHGREINQQARVIGGESALLYIPRCVLLDVSRHKNRNSFFFFSGECSGCLQPKCWASGLDVCRRSRPIHIF